MDFLEYLFAGFAVFWAGLFVYMLTLQFRLRALMREVERLEERLAEHEGVERDRVRERAEASTPAVTQTGSEARVD